MQIYISIRRLYGSKNKTTSSKPIRGRQKMECRKILHRFFFLLGRRLEM
jgi:hypothetical protein